MGIFENQYYPNAAYDPYDNEPFKAATKAYEEGQELIRSSVSPESQDRAAARVRARVDSQRLSQDKEIGEQQSRRGIFNSGMTDKKFATNRATSQQALGRGLSDLEDTYNARRLEGGKAMSDAGNKYGALGQAEYNTANETNLAASTIDTNQRRTANEILDTIMKNVGYLANSDYGRNWTDPASRASNNNAAQILRSTLQSYGIDPSLFTFFDELPVPAGITESTPGIFTGEPTDPNLSGGGTPSTPTNTPSNGPGAISNPNWPENQTTPPPMVPVFDYVDGQYVQVGTGPALLQANGQPYPARAKNGDALTTGADGKKYPVNQTYIWGGKIPPPFSFTPG